MIASTLFVRVVPQERGRGWMLLASWEKPVIQRTCIRLTTLSAMTQEKLDAIIAGFKAEYNVNDVQDVTPDSVKKQVAKDFLPEAS